MSGFSQLLPCHHDICVMSNQVRVLAVNTVGNSRPSETTEATRTPLRTSVFSSRESRESFKSPIETPSEAVVEKPIVARIEPIDHYYKIEGQKGM